jgi:hypothetical protein
MVNPHLRRCILNEKKKDPILLLFVLWHSAIIYLSANAVFKSNFAYFIDFWSESTQCRDSVLHTSLLIFGQKISEYTFKVQQNQNFVVKNTYYSDGQNLVYKGYPHTSQMSLEKDLTFSRANGSVHFESYFSIKFNPTNSKNPWWGAYFCR